ncbi:MAG TPA: hypothetical protein VLW26_03370 [Steroidobacteraceae bacterium]|nr:hypothetical protein [Steroidobacteraceae bacterium]
MGDFIAENSMPKKSGTVLMVGSVPCQTAEQVFRLLGPAIGDLLIGLSDGEPGYRNKWIVFNAPHVFEPNPALEAVNKPKGNRDKTVFKDLEDWVPTSWEEMWRFRVREGYERVSFDNLHYAEFARESYETFRKLRTAGVIPPGPRFQVSLPLPEDFTRWCTGTDRDFTIMRKGVEDALVNEVDKLLKFIPHQDLAIQWDVCWEVFACDTGDYMGREPLAFRGSGDPYDRFASYIRRLSPRIPPQVLLGMHLCYGDLEHSHLIEPKDLGVCVRMTNVAIANAGRPLNFVQMPVPRNRADDAYFEPLRDLKAGTDTTLFIGLVHLTDGTAGSLKRLAAFRRHYRGAAGVATECGWGRRKLETIPALMQVHREVAEAL